METLIDPGKLNTPITVLISLPLTGMETPMSYFPSQRKTTCFNFFTPHGDGNLNFEHLGIMVQGKCFNFFTPHGDGNSSTFIKVKIAFLVLISLPLTGMETFKAYKP